MSEKFMKVKRIVVPAICMMLCVMQLTGCGVATSEELLSLLESGEQIEIVVPMPSGAEELQGTPVEWKALSYLTDQEDLRKSIDDTLGIISYGESKNGMLYVNPETEEWEPNNTLENVYKNKVFTEALEDEEITEKLNEAVLSAYVDLDEKTDGAVLRLVALNAYFNIFPADEDTAEFNGDAYLSRAQFMSGIAKAHLQAMDGLKASENAVGQLGDTAYTAYAELVSENAYLDLESKSLNSKNFNGLITRAEVAYMIANIYYADELASVDTSNKNSVYSDVKNAGNMSEETSSMEQYKAANMQYMVENPKKGIDEELYKAMVVCYNHGVFGSESKSRWDEPITKLEALETLENVYKDLGTTVKCQNGSNQRAEINGDTSYSKLDENITYTFNGTEYVAADFENAGALWYLEQTGHLPYVTYADWCDKISSMMYPFEDWLALSASQRASTLSEHMYNTVKNHVSWSETDEELGNMTADQKLWLYMIYNYDVDEETFNTCKEFYEEFGASTVEEARMYEATNKVYMEQIYNTILGLDSMTQEEIDWHNTVVALEESESKATSTKGGSSSTSKPTGNNASTGTSSGNSNIPQNDEVVNNGDPFEAFGANVGVGEKVNNSASVDNGFASGLHQ